MKDLVILVADKNMEFTLKGVLERIPAVENIKVFDFDIYTHPEHDPGIYQNSHEFLRMLRPNYNYCMAILDHEGSGQETKSRIEIENEIEHNLSINGWDDHCCAVVISPELENWMWINSVHLRNAIGWNQEKNIFDWLIDEGFKSKEETKPARPKESLEAALRLSNTPRSSAIYYEISRKARYLDCTDASFNKFIDIIRRWFG